MTPPLKVIETEPLLTVGAVEVVPIARVLLDAVKDCAELELATPELVMVAIDEDVVVTA